uniref:Chemokine vCXCL3A n=1 Tax=Simian cytomegalovirus (strain Colburn) TaxID=50292 RepID=D2E306_SCMVC|nr:chemokine vCXCL3A [Cercopithecine betaherpesvirus 5]
MNVMWSPRFLAVALLIVSLIAYSESSQGIRCECKKGTQKIPENKIVVKKMKRPSGPNHPRTEVKDSTKQPGRDPMGRPVSI